MVAIHDKGSPHDDDDDDDDGDDDDNVFDFDAVKKKILSLMIDNASMESRTDGPTDRHTGLLGCDGRIQKRELRL